MRGCAAIGAGCIPAHIGLFCTYEASKVAETLDAITARVVEGKREGRVSIRFRLRGRCLVFRCASVVDFLSGAVRTADKEGIESTGEHNLRAITRAILTTAINARCRRYKAASPTDNSSRTMSHSERNAPCQWTRANERFCTASCSAATYHALRVPCMDRWTGLSRQELQTSGLERQTNDSDLWRARPIPGDRLRRPPFTDP